LGGEPNFTQKDVQGQDSRSRKVSAIKTSSRVRGRRLRLPPGRQGAGGILRGSFSRLEPTSAGAVFGGEGGSGRSCRGRVKKESFVLLQRAGQNHRFEKKWAVTGGESRLRGVSREREERRSSNTEMPLESTLKKEIFEASKRRERGHGCPYFVKLRPRSGVPKMDREKMILYY